MFLLKSDLILFDENEQLITNFSKKLLACTGIAFPEQFFNDLRNSGYDILTTKSFPDHHQFLEGDMQEILTQIQETGAEGVVITDKDFSRWPGIPQTPTFVARQKLHCDNSENLLKLLIDS